MSRSKVTMPTACLLGLLVLCSTALAQDVRARREAPRASVQQLSAEEAAAAWTWEAKGVAHEVGLDAALADRLAEIYIAGRTKLDEAMREGREAADGGDDRRQRWGMILEAHREALQAEMAGFLTAGQAERAATSLAAYNRQWDRMVAVVIGFDLGAEKTLAALKPINAYVVQLSDLSQLEDREAMRLEMQEARAELNEAMVAVLSEEQFARFAEATSRWGGRGEGRGRGNPRDDREAGEEVAAAPIGEPAPGFTLPDSDGVPHSLADYKGRIVVLQWINPDCPICRRTSSSGKVAAMRKLLDEITDNAVHLAINSTHYMEPAASAEYLKQYMIDAPALIDRDGTVGHLYGAKRTPHLFVIDAEGVLRYQGAIDDDANGDEGLEAKNYAAEAVRQIVAGETVAPDVTKPYGCTIKYKP